MAVLEAPKARSARRAPRVATGLVVVVGVLSLATAALAARTLLHRGEVMPGVEVLGSDLGGLDARAAAGRVEQVVAARLAKPIPLDVGPRQVRMVPAKVLRPDVDATVAAALAAGRDDWRSRLRSLLAPLTPPIRIQPGLQPVPKAGRRVG